MGYWTDSADPHIDPIFHSIFFFNWNVNAPQEKAALAPNPTLQEGRQGCATVVWWWGLT